MRYNYDAWGNVTVLRDHSECSLSINNPFLYRGYIYDREYALYYLQSRYYDPELGRFLNPDEPTFIGAGNTIPNAYAYCDNDPVNDKDIFGRLSAKKLAEMFSITSIFGLFAPMLFANYSQGLVAVGTYTTGLITPIAAKAFWWKPWLIPIIIAAAVAIVVASIMVLYSNRQDEINKAKSKISNKIMKNGKVDLSKFSKKPNNGPPKWVGPLGYELFKDMSEHKGPAYKLYLYGIRIATIALDGTIIGK